MISEAIFTDDWYFGLTDPQRLAWLHFLLLAKRERGSVGKCSPKTLAHALILSENAVMEMVKSAIENGKITETSSGRWSVVNWAKYQSDPTNSSRQDKHRKSLVTENTVTERYVTKSNGRTEIERNGTDHKNLKKDSLVNVAAAPVDPLAQLALEIPNHWNLLARQIGLPCIQVPPNKKRIANIRERLKQPGFDWGELQRRIAASDFLSGRSQNGKDHDKWRLTFDWVFGSANNWQKIMEGNYDNRGAPIPQAERPEPSKWELDWREVNGKMKLVKVCKVCQETKEECKCNGR